MLNEIMPRIYKRLRLEADLTKKGLASLIDSSRYTVARFENGTSVPTGEQVEKMLELARCTHERGGEMVCEELGKETDKRYGILPDGLVVASATTVEKAEMLVAEYPHKLSVVVREGIRAKLKTIHLVGLANQGHNAELRKLVDRGFEELDLDGVFP